ncbi:hypothetical protein N7530_003796 [Penicillium desertorum]|uniref:Uncharacterized protein n=1 Tax=Penicillium desertorum TaxID=1303715 RepID=A0A9W9WX52_9EURO|nr:hypothetical protein N7530_003796 [Penicillium desertorum]
MASILGRPSTIPVNRPNPPDPLTDTPSLTRPYLAANGVPLGCAHMQFEVFALVHYANGFWIHNGPEEPRDLRSAVAAKLKVLIRDFMRAVRSHRQEWEITDADRTRETSIAYGRACQDALGDLPLEYSLGIDSQTDRKKPGHNPRMASGLSKISRAGSLYANNLISKIAITNSIHIEAHMGSVDGTNVIWAPNLADNLSRNAEDYDVRRNVMESSTEHVGGSAPTQKQQATALCTLSQAKYNLNYLGHSSFLAELGARLTNLCSAFRLLARNHIAEHGIHNGCSGSRRAHYRQWLLSRQPIPVAINLDGGPEKFAEFSMSKHKYIDTEDNVHFWYGAIQSFRQSVERIVEECVQGTAYQAKYEERLARFPDQILPVASRLSR